MHLPSLIETLLSVALPLQLYKSHLHFSQNLYFFVYCCVKTSRLIKMYYFALRIISLIRQSFSINVPPVWIWVVKHCYATTLHLRSNNHIFILVFLIEGVMNYVAKPNNGSAIMSLQGVKP